MRAVLFVRSNAPSADMGICSGAMESGVCLYVSFVTVSVGIAPVASAPGVHGPRTADLQLSATSYGHAML